MQQSDKNHFAPRWATLIYIVSVLEAVGLSIYFTVSFTDPEMASMQPQYVEMQQLTATAAEQPVCEHCLLLARSPHQAAIKR